MIWEIFATQDAYQEETFPNINTKYDIQENVIVSSSFFHDIGNNGAIKSLNNSASIVIVETIFELCKNNLNGGAISVTLSGSASFSILHSCIFNSQCLGNSSYGASLCINSQIGFLCDNKKQCSL